MNINFLLGILYFIGGIILDTLNGCAVKIKGISADHTYVTSSAGHKWGCWGISDGGAVLVTKNGNAKKADYMSQPNSTAGLLYGLNGVCHQTANRILYFTKGTVHEAKCYWLSHLMYGTYGGNSLSLAVSTLTALYFKQRVDEANKQFGVDVSISLKDERNMLEYVTKVQNLYMNTDETKLKAPNDKYYFLEKELELMTDLKLSQQNRGVTLKFLKDSQRYMLDEKDKLSFDLVKDNINSEDYADKINTLFSNFNKDSTSQLDKETHTRLFGVNQDESVQIVDPSQIPVDEIKKYFKDNKLL